MKVLAHLKVRANGVNLQREHMNHYIFFARITMKEYPTQDKQCGDYVVESVLNSNICILLNYKDTEIVGILILRVPLLTCIF